MRPCRPPPLLALTLLLFAASSTFAFSGVPKFVQHLSRAHSLVDRALGSTPRNNGRFAATSRGRVGTPAVRMQAGLEEVVIGKSEGSKGSVLIAGAGLAGLSAAKHLADRGYTPTVVESRNVLGGKVAAWQDEDGDWYETGLHIFFGAYPNMLQLFEDLDIRERLQWKKHAMIFAMPGQKGVFSRFDFPDIPGPFNGLVAILRNNEMIGFVDKLRFGIALIPAILEGQAYVEQMDSITISEWLRQRGAPPSIEREIFVAMAKALAFVDPDKVSATVVLTALNRFLREGDGSKVAFLDGAPPERLCKPLVEYIEKKGGKVLLNHPLDSIEVNADSSVDAFKIRGVKDPSSGQLLPTRLFKADKYVSCVPVHIFQKLVPPAWSDPQAPMAPFFDNIKPLESVPVINLHLWFDKKLEQLEAGDVNNLIFSKSKLLSVYADMSNTCKEYYDPDRSMLELVFAPASARFGGATVDEFGEYEDWIGRSDEDIVQATMEELQNLFPKYFGDEATEEVKLRKFKVVKTPLSVYWSRPGMQKHRPTQSTPIPNFFLGGDYTLQKYLASMEGAVLSGKQVAEAIAAADEGRAESDQSSVLTIEKGDWPTLVRDVA